MYKKTSFLVSILLVLAFASCNLGDANIAIYKLDPIETKLAESNATQTITVHIHHKNKFVTKTVAIEEYLLSENGNINDLKEYAAAIEDMFNGQEIFQTEGFEYSVELINRSLLVTTIKDFTRININDLSDSVKEFFYGSDLSLVDEESRVLYDKIIESYTDWGFYKVE